MSAKSKLSELCQKKYKCAPSYATVRSAADPGPDHEPNFDVHVTLPDGRAFNAEAQRGSKQEAETKMAEYVYDLVFPEWEMQSRIVGGSLADLLSAKASCSTEQVLHKRATARVVRVRENSVEAYVDGTKAKVRLSGKIADGVERGMLIEISIKTRFR